MRVNGATGEHQSADHLRNLIASQSESLRGWAPFIVGGEKPISEVDESAAAVFPQLDA